MEQVSLPKTEFSRLPYVGVLTVDPGLADQGEANLNFRAQLAQDPKAMVLLAQADGCTPDALNPLIKQCTDDDVPVFLLSNKGSDKGGIQKISYDAQSKAVKAGAIPLRDVNAHQVITVVEVIQKAAGKGVTGQDLKKKIIAQFGTPVQPPTK